MTENLINESNLRRAPLGIIKWHENFLSKWKGTEHEGHSKIIDISMSRYTNSYSHTIFDCAVHGLFRSTPANLMNRGGCPKCVNKKNRVTTKEFIKRAKKIHGDLYDYSKTVYKGMNDQVLITCKLHGDFYLRAASHVHPAVDNGNKKYYSGCQKCSESIRFKAPDPETLMKQIEKESGYNIVRTTLNMTSKEYVDSLLNELITSGVFMVRNDDVDSSKLFQLNFATKFASKLHSLAIDIITEPLAVCEDFLRYVEEQTMNRIIFLGDKFGYDGVGSDSDLRAKLDKIKEPAWKLVDACGERLSNGNKQVCITRQDAGKFL